MGNWGWGGDELTRPVLETQIPVNLEHTRGEAGWQVKKAGGARKGPAEDAGHLLSLLALLSVHLGEDPIQYGLWWCLSAGLCLEGGVLVMFPSACCRWGQQGGPLSSSMLLQSRDVEGCVMKNLHPLHRQGLGSS